MIRVNEIFGPTIQGEGPNTGRHCMFVRVSRCNLHCSWCDTPYTWATTPFKATLHNSGHLYDASKEEIELTVEEVISTLVGHYNIRLKPTLIVISGGEPMLQQVELAPLIEELLEMGCDIEIETAGTVGPSVNHFWDPRIHYEVSPKLEHSGNDLRAAFRPVELTKLIKCNSDFKFVVASLEDLEEVATYAELLEI
jgi:7-carboxy-7-deazaguanine synthase